MSSPEPHSISQSLFLHLFPGVINAATTVLAFTALWNPEIPTALVFSAFVNVIALIPVQLGFLFYLAKKRGNRGWSLEGIVLYNAKLNWRRYLLWVPSILVPTAIVFLALQPVTDEFRSLFGFMDLIPATDPDKSYPQWLINITLISSLTFTAFLVPITEELYFRSYLLPRMPREFGAAGPSIHSLLFAVYHFDSPWMIPVRTIGLLPIIYVTRHTKSVMPAIISHCLVNAIEAMNVTQFRDA